MIFKNLCILELWRKVASALDGLSMMIGRSLVYVSQVRMRGWGRGSPYTYITRYQKPSWKSDALTAYCFQLLPMVLGSSLPV